MRIKDGRFKLDPEDITAIAQEVIRIKQEEERAQRKLPPANIPEYLRLWNRATSAESTKEDRKRLDQYHNTQDMTVIR